MPEPGFDSQRDGAVHLTEPVPPPDCIGTLAGAAAEPEPWPTAIADDDEGDEDTVAGEFVLWLCETSFGASAHAAKAREAKNNIAVMRRETGAGFNFI